MASGMNGQEFHFAGYLPIDARARQQRIRELEAESGKQNGTQIFIETPYRNMQLLETLCNTCRPETRLCIAVNLTGKEEMIRTRTISEWKKKLPDIQKKPAIFLLQARPS
jgi:16S rRNA (cytidine1402-2'-O)-methyltransferase